MSQDNYSYVVARVRSRKKFLLKEDDYQNLIRMGTNEIARFMEETEYQDEINELGSRYSGADLVERALYKNLSKHFSDILRWCQGELEQMVSEYLRRYDSWNIKTAFRGIQTGSSEEEIMADFIPAGQIDQEKLIGHETVEELVEELSNTIFGDSLEEALRDYNETQLLAPLENAVSRTFYEGLVREKTQNQEDPKQAYYQQIKSEIDLLNIRNAVRASKSVSIDEFFVEGGKLSKSEIKKAMENMDFLEDILSDYGAQNVIEQIRRGEGLSELDSLKEEILIEYGRKMSNRYPLSIAPVLSYILSKEYEVKRIRAITRGKESGLSTEEIQEMIS